MREDWENLTGKIKTNKRLVWALASYVVLGIVAVFTLDGFFRLIVLLFFLWLAVKTVAHADD